MPMTPPLSPRLRIISSVRLRAWGQSSAAVAVAGDHGPAGDVGHLGERQVGRVRHVHHDPHLVAELDQLPTRGGEAGPVAEDRAREGIVAPGQRHKTHAGRVEVAQKVDLAHQGVGALERGDGGDPARSLGRRGDIRVPRREHQMRTVRPAEILDPFDLLHGPLVLGAGAPLRVRPGREDLRRESRLEHAGQGHVQTRVGR